MRFKIISISCACLLGCASIYPGNNPTVVFEDGYHFGILNKSLIKNHDTNTWFSKQYDTYRPELNRLEPSNLLHISIKVFMGTWCHDSKREVPRFYKILDELNYNYANFKIIGLTKDKKGYFHDYTSFNITHTPTIIFYRNGTEIGRIIEKPDGSLESHLLRIISS